MSAVWIALRDALRAAVYTDFNAMLFERESAMLDAMAADLEAKLPLLTPAQAAVIAAAKALRDSDDKDDNQWFTSYVELCALKSRVDTLRAQEGE